MKKVVIIEDELLSATRLRNKILDIDDTLQVDGPLRSVKEVVDYLQSHDDYDLVFSDIRLLDGNVFMAFSYVMPSSFVIFTTAYDEYAMQAIKNNGIDYLLKPIDEDELRMAINKVKLRPSPQNLSSIVADVGNRYKERLLVYKGDDMVSLAVCDIFYFCKNEGYTTVMDSTGNSYKLSSTIQEMEDMLNPTTFFRLNRKYLINIKALKKVCTFFNSKLIVKLYHCQDEHIIVSKEKSSRLKEWLNM